MKLNSVTVHNHPHKPQEKYFRLALFSVNAISIGTNNLDCTFQVDIPESLPLDAQTAWQFAPEYFGCNSSVVPTSLLDNITNLTQPNTYSTLTQSTNFTIMALRATTYQRFIDFNSIGFPVANINFMRGGRLTITFTDVTGAENVYMNGQLGMILVIWKVPHPDE